MSLKTQFTLFSKYNSWMNQNLLSSCKDFDDELMNKDLGAFFHSIHETFNHIMVADTVWLRRFASHPYLSYLNAQLAEFPKFSGLNRIFFADRVEFKEKRVQLDKIIEALIQDTPEDFLQEDIIYSNTRGMTFQTPFYLLLNHFFNHQTHHRGQITTLIKQNGVDPGVTDLVAFMRRIS